MPRHDQPESHRHDRTERRERHKSRSRSPEPESHRHDRTEPRERHKSRSRSPRRHHHKHHHHSRHSGGDPSESRDLESRSSKPGVSTAPPPPLSRPSTAPGSLPPGVAAISMEDFHRYSTQFRLWLKQIRGLLLFDLPKDDAKARFAEFVVAWNTGAVPGELYREDAVTTLSVDAARTAHTWSFALAGDAERDRLHSISLSVTAQTNPGAHGAPSAAAAPAATARSSAGYSGPLPGSSMVGPQRREGVPLGPTAAPGIGASARPAIIGPSLPPPRRSA
jgi:hypothetical protein